MSALLMWSRLLMAIKTIHASDNTALPRPKRFSEARSWNLTPSYSPTILSVGIMLAYPLDCAIPRKASEHDEGRSVLRQQTEE